MALWSNFKGWHFHQMWVLSICKGVEGIYSDKLETYGSDGLVQNGYNIFTTEMSNMWTQGRNGIGLVCKKKKNNTVELSFSFQPRYIKNQLNVQKKKKKKLLNFPYEHTNSDVLQIRVKCFYFNFKCSISLISPTCQKSHSPVFCLKFLMWYTWEIETHLGSRQHNSNTPFVPYTLDDIYHDSKGSIGTCR